jgi:hypothetical protein
VEFGALNAPPNRPRRLGRRVLAVLVLIGAGIAAAVYLRRPTPGPVTAEIGPRFDRLVPEGTRVRVEVLNATDARGLARRAMFVLRDAGFDVVYYGTTSERADSTTVLDRTGHAEWAALAVRAMGGGRTTAKPDSSRYVDLTVLVGRQWSPPSKPLYP